MLSQIDLFPFTSTIERNVFRIILKSAKAHDKEESFLPRISLNLCCSIALSLKAIKIVDSTRITVINRKSNVSISMDLKFIRKQKNFVALAVSWKS